MNPIKKIALLFVLLSAGHYAFSQDENNPGLGPLITDRPDATESPAVVTKGYIQMETGAFFETFEEGGVKVNSTVFNTSLLRIGVLNNIELRLGWDLNRIKTTINGETASELSGLTPVLLGTKIAIAKEDNSFADIGLLSHIYFPFTAGRDFRPDYTRAEMILSVGHTLSEKSSIGYNLGAEWGGDTTDVSYLYTLAYGYSISERFGVYAEVYGNLPDGQRSNHFWDAGFTYLMSDNFQFDATIGQSITEGQDILISGGLSFRLPYAKQKQ